MIRLAFYVGKVRKQIGGTSRRSQKRSGALVETNKASYLRRNRKRALSEDLLNWQTCRGHSVSPTHNFTYYCKARPTIYFTNPKS